MINHFYTPDIPGATPLFPPMLGENYHFSELTLKRRFETLAQKKELTFEFTRNPAMLHQYYQLREQMFISVWGLKKFYGGEDEYDDVSDILIVRQGNMCVGGARLTYSSPDNNQKLPMEKPDFKLASLLPELDLENNRYAECTRFTLLPEFGAKWISFEMRKQLILRAYAKGIKYGFWIAPLLQARNNRQTCVSLGMDCKILSKAVVPDLPEYESIKMYLVMLDYTTLDKNKLDALEHSDVAFA